MAELSNLSNQNSLTEVHHSGGLQQAGSASDLNLLSHDYGIADSSNEEDVQPRVSMNNRRESSEFRSELVGHPAVKEDSVTTIKASKLDLNQFKDAMFEKIKKTFETSEFQKATEFTETDFAKFKDDLLGDEQDNYSVDSDSNSGLLTQLLESANNYEEVNAIVRDFTNINQQRAELKEYADNAIAHHRAEASRILQNNFQLDENAASTFLDTYSNSTQSIHETKTELESIAAQPNFLNNVKTQRPNDSTEQILHDLIKMGIHDKQNGVDSESKV